MSYCHLCREHYQEPEDEQGDHPCPRCGLLPPYRTLKFYPEEIKDDDEREED